MPETNLWDYGQSGPRVAFTDRQRERDLQLIDLETGVISIVARASERQVMDIAMSGDRIVWVDGRFDGYEDYTPCGNQGGVKWKIRLTNIGNATTKQLATGRNTILQFCTAGSPLVAMDGDLLAYGVEYSRPGFKKGWRIAVVSAVDGSLVRNIDTERELVDLALDDGNVAFIEGLYPKGGDFWPDQIRLMLSTATATAPIEVATETLALSYEDGRLTWTALGDSEPGHVATATTEHLTPTDLGVATGRPDPFTAGDLVLFGSPDGLRIWSADNQTAYTIQDAAAAYYFGTAHDEWATWVGDVLTGDIVTSHLYGVALADLKSAISK